MNYLEFKFKVSPLVPYQEILMYELGEMGFESFTEESDGLNAYIAEDEFSEDQLSELYLFTDDSVQISFEKQLIPQQNWNAEWERSFPKVTVDDYCEIIAPFHEKSTDCEFSILIEPKMSFGTGHHDTTFMMMQLMRQLDLSDKLVMDMGCGTGVLAILAKLEGASGVTAVDIDDWAFENTLENIERNNVSEIEVLKGGAEKAKGKSYDVFIANINRNILMRDLPAYAETMKTGADLLLSGFFITDFEQLDQKLKELGFSKVNKVQRNNWCALHYKK
ncbi:50S ribosomal protein L11 methyltransferase [bacterium]|nr:50S ribosomal protein L11 methyltransferase [bacterium]